jgi:cysteinyl-tRNA synthetase
MMDKPPLTLYNTLTRKKEIFKPLHSPEVTLYTCGPTVYHYVHIGNLRTFIFEDLLRRTLKYLGYRVKQAMNLTDVDDKTIRGARAKGVSLNDFTKTYKEAFFHDIKTLNIEPVEYYPAATDYIKDMVRMVETLLAKGMAYKSSDGSIYYPIDRFASYGCLSHLQREELKEGASQRVASDEYEKDHVSDFVLWKAYDPERDGDIYWESPFGKGRPGWHLECSAMAINLLGETIDIHVGGIDNMFPHHENEIAQSEACTGKRFVAYWMHAEHLIVEGKKMAKSLGNFYTLRDLTDKGYSGKEIRYMLLHTHYKTPLNFTMEGLSSVRESIRRLQDFIYRLQAYSATGKGGELSPLLQKAEKEFSGALADDLNISSALAALFEVVRTVNLLIDQQRITTDETKEVLNSLWKWNDVLGILDFTSHLDIPYEIEKLFQDRQQARHAKNWQEADRLRIEIGNRGYAIEDSPQGARLKKL